MSEWWTYTLTDFLLFSPRTYYRLFELYNAAVWPLQLVALALGLAILMTIMRGAAWSGRVVAALLAAFWLLIAWFYLLERYDTINWAGRHFAIGFVVQAALLAWSGIVRDRLRFSSTPLIPAQAGIQSPTHRASERQSWVPAFAGTSGVRWPGLALIIYALIIHPLIAPLTGRPWMQAEIFGLAPDPTAVATLGILLAADRSRLHLFAIPFLWCVITGLTLWTMESPEAPVVPFLAVFAAGLGAWKTLVRQREAQ